MIIQILFFFIMVVFQALIFNFVIKAIQTQNARAKEIKERLEELTVKVKVHNRVIGALITALEQHGDEEQ